GQIGRVLAWFLVLLFIASLSLVLWVIFIKWAASVHVQSAPTQWDSTLTTIYGTDSAQHGANTMLFSNLTQAPTLFIGNARSVRGASFGGVILVTSIVPPAPPYTFAFALSPDTPSDWEGQLDCFAEL